MRLIFYIFVFSQLLNLNKILAEKIKKESREQTIKWEKVVEKKSNNLKKIIWKSYNDDSTYFENKNINNSDNNTEEIFFNTKNKKKKHNFLPDHRFHDYRSRGYILKFCASKYLIRFGIADSILSLSPEVILSERYLMAK